VGLNHPSIAPYGAYACESGDQVVISIQNNREWQNFCEQVLGRPELVDDPHYRNNVDRCTNRPALDRQINAVFSRMSRYALVERLLDARIAFGSVNSVADLSRHQQLRRCEVATPSGAVSLVAPPVITSAGNPGLRPVPALDEQGDAIRREFGSRG
jgi:crotonobetainyl-CoA:carnitine CoA-transferase CaiB-like acyl-CoA transferase